MDVGNLISGSSASSKSNLYIWKFWVHILLKPNLEDFEHYLDSMWNECNCEAVWTLFGLAHLWHWNENWPFPVLWPLLSFPNCWHIECSTFTAPSFKIWNSFISILLTIFLMLYISSPWLIYLIIEFASLSPLHLSLFTILLSGNYPLFSISEYVFILFCIFLDFTYNCYHMEFVWLTSLSIIHSRIIHIVLNSKISFLLLLGNILLCIYIYIY